MNEYHKLEEPDVYKARRLAIEIANSTVKNQMIMQEHSRYKLLREEVERQNIKERALQQLSEQRNIQPSDKAVFERVLVNANRQPELNGRSRSPLPTPPPPMSDQGEEDEEKEGEDDVPEMIKLYNDMDDEQLQIVLEAFKTDIDNLGPEARARLREKGEQQIELYGGIMNAGVYDLIAELLEYIDEVDEEEEEEEGEEEVEEKEEEGEVEEEVEEILTTAKQIKDYIKGVGYRKYVDQLRRGQLDTIYEMIKRGQSREAIEAKIEAYYDEKKGPKIARKKKMGNGLTQLGTGIAENLQKLMVMVGSKQAGNDSAALLKKIVALQKKIKKDIEKKRKSESEAVRKELTRQKIKKLAKDQMK